MKVMTREQWGRVPTAEKVRKGTRRFVLVPAREHGQKRRVEVMLHDYADHPELWERKPGWH